MTENQEKAKKFLYNIANIPEAIDTKKLELERFRTMTEGIKGISYDKDSVQTSPTDRMADSVIKLLEITESIEADIKKYAENYSNIMLILDLMDKDESQMIQLHFFQHKTFYQIASIMHISERTAMRIYSDALENFGIKMKDDISWQ